MNDAGLLQASNRAYDVVFKSTVEISCLKAARELNLFEHLASGPVALNDLAARLEAVPARLEKFLIALSQMGFVVAQEGTWRLTSFAECFFLAPPCNPNLTMTSFVDYMIDQMESYYLRLADVVRGQADFTSVVPYPPRTREDSIFYETIHRNNLYFPIKLLSEHVRLEGVRHLVDAGGGIGDVAAALCTQFPDLSVTLLNLPSALDLVRENMQARGLEGRVTPLALDMYREPYPACDAVLFSRILYPMNAQLSTMLCRKAADALPSGGRIIILDMVIDDPERPNYDYLSHYLCAIGTDFSVLDFKSHTIYPDVLHSTGFDDVTFNAGYDYVLYQAVKR